MNILLSLLIVAATAQVIDPRHPDAVEVFHCGFEEKADHDADGWPDGWTRRRGPNFPAYLPIKIVECDAPDGATALRLGLNGGGACVSTPPIVVASAFSYVLEGCLKTEGLKNNRAFITISFRDAAGNVLQTFSTDKYADATSWTKLRLGPITAESDKVRSAVISLHLEPIAELPDLRGAALFDDLWLGRLPRMSLQANRAGNVYTDGTQIDIHCKVSGIYERNPQMRCELLDAEGRLVGEPTIHRLESKAAATQAPRDQILSAKPAEQDYGFVDSLHWKPVVSEPGFYRAKVTLEGSTQNVLGRELTFVVIEPRKIPPRGEFGWTLPQGDKSLSYNALGQMLPQMGLGWVKFPVWRDAKRPERLDELVAFAERLSLLGVESIGLLADPPDEIRPQLGDAPVLTAAAVFSSEPDVWYKSLEPATTRLSMQLHWWQLGHDHDMSLVGDARLPKRVSSVKKELEQFGQQAHVGLGWSMLHEAPGDKRPTWDFLNLDSELPLTQSELGQYMPAIDTKRALRFVSLEPLDSKYALDDRTSDLVQRMVAAKRHGAAGIFVPQPFDDSRGLMHADGTPSELLLPWRTTAQALSGTTYLGSLALPEGSTNHVFAREGEMVMVLWNSVPVEERLFVGDGVKIVDVWGRGVAPAMEEHEHVIPVGPVPCFLVGMSEPIVRWNMACGFDKLQFPSVFGHSHANAVVIKNFFPQGTSGQMRLHTPDVWRTTPRVMNLKLAAGEEQQVPFAVRLPFDATTGRYPIRIDFEITADRPYRFSVYRELEVGLGDVAIEMTSHLNDKGELEVEQYFTNKGDQLVSFKCSLHAPDRRRMVSQVTRLGSQRDLKRYVFPNGQELIGKTISLRAEEIGGERTFNYRLIAKP